MTNAQELAKALADQRTAHGDPSYRMIARGILPILGDRTPTDETIRAYHAGKVKHVDLGIATALATYYGTTLGDLCPDLADEARELVLTSAKKRAPPLDWNPVGARSGWAAAFSDLTPRRYQLPWWVDPMSGSPGTRTLNLQIKSLLLYQLS